MPFEWTKKFFLMSFFCFLALLDFLWALPLPSRAATIEIEQELQEQMEADETTGYVIYFRGQANLAEIPKTEWQQQSKLVNKALQEAANQSQARVRSYLFNRRIPFRSLWVDNVIIVDRSDRDTFEGLASFPEIKAVRPRQEPKVVKQPVSQPPNKEGAPTDSTEDKEPKSGSEPVINKEGGAETR